MANAKLRKHAENRIGEEWGMDTGVSSPEPEQIAAWMLMTALDEDGFDDAKAAKLRREAYEILSERHPATFPFRLDTPE